MTGTKIIYFMKGRYLNSFMFGIFILGSVSWNSELVTGFSSLRKIDNIELSHKKASLTADSDSAVFTTKGTCWWINRILVDGQTVDFKVADSQNDKFKLNGKWFTIERHGRQELKVKTFDNQFVSTRNIQVILEVGRYQDTITVEQKGVNHWLAMNEAEE